MAILFFVFAQQKAAAQEREIKTLLAKLDQWKQKPARLNDTAYLNTINKLALLYADQMPDSALALVKPMTSLEAKDIPPLQQVDAFKMKGNAYQTKGLFDSAQLAYQTGQEIAEKAGLEKPIPALLNNLGIVSLNQGRYSAALGFFYQAVQLAEQQKNAFVAMSALNNIAVIQFYQGKLVEAEKAYQQALDLSWKAKDTASVCLTYSNLGEVATERKDYAHAIALLDTGIVLATQKDYRQVLSLLYVHLGNAYLHLDSLAAADQAFRKSLSWSTLMDYSRPKVKAWLGLATLYDRKGQWQLSLAFAEKALQLSKKMGQAQLTRDALKVLADASAGKGDHKMALDYFKQFKFYADSLNSLETERLTAEYQAAYAFSKKEYEYQKAADRKNWLLLSSLLGILALFVFAVFLYRGQLKLNKTNLQLAEKQNEAENALEDLKLTQKQLVQSEKMASLGELTAGIAHEIQNPLNFINNFAEVSAELSQDLEQAIRDNNLEEAQELSADLRQNMGKITYHGGRADGIIKSMLQHSRKGSGKMEATDINLLCDEYLRLAYHGYRAKDPSFKCQFHADLDNQLGMVQVYPQELGRVLLNLINNAFYAATQERKPEGQEAAWVKVTTQKLANGFEIKVADNGPGVPAALKEKIFQPFFTTKPTGKGTGLGLSLSYDMVTRLHGGQLRILEQEGPGATFVLFIPKNIPHENFGSR